MPTRLWTGLLSALAFAAGAILGGMFLAIVLDVSLRAVGLQPPLWTGTYIEFGLLYSTMLAAPWLISRDGHIRVRALTDRLSPRRAARLEQGTHLILAAICLLLAWYALDVTMDAATRGEQEYRSIVLPRWILFAPMPFGFALMFLEFLRAGIAGLRSHAGAADAERSL